MSFFDFFRKILNRKFRVILEGANDGKGDSFYVDVARFEIPSNAVAVKINGSSLKYVGMLDGSGNLHVGRKESGEVLKLPYAFDGLSSVHALVVEDKRVFYDVRNGVRVAKDLRLLGFLSRMVEECPEGFDFGKLFEAYGGKA